MGDAHVPAAKKGIRRLLAPDRAAADAGITAVAAEAMGARAPHQGGARRAARRAADVAQPAVVPHQLPRGRHARGAGPRRRGVGVCQGLQRIRRPRDRRRGRRHVPRPLPPLLPAAHLPRRPHAGGRPLAGGPGHRQQRQGVRAAARPDRHRVPCGRPFPQGLLRRGALLAALHAVAARDARGARARPGARLLDRRRLLGPKPRQRTGAHDPRLPDALDRGRALAPRAPPR
mmetsp:Transcript_10611/g.27337  ORF Transcript_10611/g.27337 Transcript_10611/m.27337 type:complete len:231 (+) Transcript_10611:852-1544(+)